MIPMKYNKIGAVIALLACGLITVTAIRCTP